MTEHNPYQTPRADLDAKGREQETELTGYWSAEGRLGRLRYMAYNVGATLLAYLVLAIAAVFLLLGDVGTILFGIAALGVFVAHTVFGVMQVVKRLHDLNQSGWLVLILLVPFIGALFALYIIFAPGSKEENNYGLPTPPNTTGVYVLGLGVLVIIPVVMGVLAAIAIPAYQDYTTRAERARIESLAPVSSEAMPSYMEGDFASGAENADVGTSLPE